MLFHSLAFAAFFPCVFALYLAFRQSRRAQNLLLLGASWLFYGWWDWRFLGLLIFSSAVDYMVGRGLGEAKDERARKALLTTSILIQAGILGTFKYYDFFAVSVRDGLALIGVGADPALLDLMLPAGISFYTFQTMSYTFDVYRRRLAPARGFAEYALFVAFFPQLIAGPIERASHLLPQFQQPRKVVVENVARGAYYFFWGLFLKVVVADNLAFIVDPVFSAPGPYEGISVLLAVLAFAFQIYGDFAGYSIMAVGLARMLGFDLMENFRRPYFAVNPSDFWRRWHISLSTWFRDYVYVPLGGSRMPTPLGVARNLMITMLLAGLWHGANWTFLAWGLIHGTALGVYHLYRRQWDGLPRPLGWLATLAVVLLGWLFFRAGSVGQAFEMLAALGSNFDPRPEHAATLARLLGFISVLLVMQGLKEWKNDTGMLLKTPLPVRNAVMALLAALMVSFGYFGDSPFIYFQF